MVGRARVNSEPPEVFASSVRLIARAANWLCFAPVSQSSDYVNVPQNRSEGTDIMGHARTRTRVKMCVYILVFGSGKCDDCKCLSKSG